MTIFLYLSILVTPLNSPATKVTHDHVASTPSGTGAMTSLLSNMSKVSPCKQQVSTQSIHHVAHYPGPYAKYALLPTENCNDFLAAFVYAYRNIIC